MKLIMHRRNTLDELLATPHHFGVEVDVRSLGGRLIMHHDPFVEGEDFLRWIAAYRHGTLILNVKEEGLEERLIDLMQGHGIEDFFFLDQSFPFLIKWSRMGESRCAVRVSEYETVATALTLAGKVNWVWVDCFSRFPLDFDGAQVLKDAGFKLCLVSPELQGRDPDTEIAQLAALLREQGIQADAVCTKRPELWERSI